MKAGFGDDGLGELCFGGLEEEEEEDGEAAAVAGGRGLGWK